MKKRIFLALIGLVVLVGSLGAIKGWQFKRMADQGAQFVPPPTPVTTAVARMASWESLLTSVGSLSAVQGVTVTAELPGKITRIAFEPGTMVNGGDLLVQQDITSEKAQLRAEEATVALAKANLRRLANLLDGKTISQSQYDDTEAQYKQAMARADNIRTIIAKKTIRAPFTGRLGIRLINLGQVLNEGDEIVSLQSLDPIFVNFSMPQQKLALVQPGLSVRVTADALPGQQIVGKITAVNPQIDAATRNIQVQATVSNAEERLRPGMFVTVTVVLPDEKKVLTIPAPAVLHAPYSDSVFVLEEKRNEKADTPATTIRQQFVKLGEKRGDFVSILSGLKEGDTVVSTGTFKLRNGLAVVPDNSLAPKFELSPEPENR